LAEGRQPTPATEDARGQETLDDFTGRYLRARSAVLAAHTIAGIETEYRLRVSTALGHLPLAAITRERVEAWVAEVAVVATSRRMLVQSVAALRGILAAAVAWDRIATNPATRLRLPSPDTHLPQAAERVLTEDELQRLLTAGSPSLRVETMLRAAGEAGLRRGELIGLRWPDVDAVARRLEVRRSVWQVRGERGEKTSKGRRSRRVAISDAFAVRLGEWYSASVVEGGADAAGYVWPGRQGAAMDAHSPTQAATRALIRAGLVDGDGRPLTTLHGLRHTCGSILLGRGVPLIVVSRHLGHADPNITARVYAHLLEDAQLDQIGDVFGELADGLRGRAETEERHR
jgi:integrase